MLTGKHGKFVELVAEDFDSIKCLFIKKSNALGIDFNEDLFMDAFLNCEKVWKDKILSKDECLKYYWIAYLNKVKTEASKQSLFVPYDDMINYNIQSPMCGSYNQCIDNTYNEIVKMAYDKFDKSHVDAWLEHVCGGKSYKELRELGYDFKFNDVFKKITKFIKTFYKNHPQSRMNF